MTAREIGMLRKELTTKPRTHSSQNRELTPSLTSVMIKVMINDITTDVNTANNNSRYLADTFKLTSRTNSAFMSETAFANAIPPKKL